MVSVLTGKELDRKTIIRLLMVEVDAVARVAVKMGFFFTTY